MSGVGLVAVAFCGGYTVRFGKRPLCYMFTFLWSTGILTKDR